MSIMPVMIRTTADLREQISDMVEVPMLEAPSKNDVARSLSNWIGYGTYQAQGHAPMLYVPDSLAIHADLMPRITDPYLYKIYLADASAKQDLCESLSQGEQLWLYGKISNELEIAVDQCHPNHRKRLEEIRGILADTPIIKKLLDALKTTRSHAAEILKEAGFKVALMKQGKNLFQPLTEKMGQGYSSSWSEFEEGAEHLELSPDAVASVGNLHTDLSFQITGLPYVRALELRGNHLAYQAFVGESFGSSFSLGFGQGLPRRRPSNQIINLQIDEKFDGENMAEFFANPNSSTRDKARVLTTAMMGLRSLHIMRDQRFGFKGLAHNDIKPSNFLADYDSEGRPVGIVTDLETLTSADDSFGNILHDYSVGRILNPNIANQVEKRRADIFSMGFVMLEMKYGKVFVRNLLESWSKEIADWECPDKFLITEISSAKLQRRFLDGHQGPFDRMIREDWIKGANKYLTKYKSFGDDASLPLIAVEGGLYVDMSYIVLLVLEHINLEETIPTVEDIAPYFEGLSVFRIDHGSMERVSLEETLWEPADSDSIRVFIRNLVTVFKQDYLNTREQVVYSFGFFQTFNSMLAESIKEKILSSQLKEDLDDEDRLALELIVGDEPSLMKAIEFYTDKYGFEGL